MDRIRRGDIWTISLPAFPKPRPALMLGLGNPGNRAAAASLHASGSGLPIHDW